MIYHSFHIASASVVPIFLCWMFECIKYCVDKKDNSDPLDLYADIRHNYVKGMASGYVIGFGSAANLASVFVFERALEKTGANDELRKIHFGAFTYQKWWPLLTAVLVTLSIIILGLLLTFYLLRQTKKTKAKHQLLAEPAMVMAPVATL